MVHGTVRIVINLLEDDYRKASSAAAPPGKLSGIIAMIEGMCFTGLSFSQERADGMEGTVSDATGARVPVPTSIEPLLPTMMVSTAS